MHYAQDKLNLPRCVPRDVPRQLSSTCLSSCSRLLTAHLYYSGGPGLFFFLSYLLLYQVQSFTEFSTFTHSAPLISYTLPPMTHIATMSLCLSLDSTSSTALVANHFLPILTLIYALLTFLFLKSLHRDFDGLNSSSLGLPVHEW